MRTSVLLVAGLLAGASVVAAPSFSHAAPAPLTLEEVDGSWVDATGAPFTTSRVGDESQIRWGIDGGFGQSGLGFTGNGGVPVDLAPGAPFPLGVLRHYNNPVFPPTATAARLSVAVTLRDVSLGQTTFAFDFGITETTNIEPCPFPGVTPCSDRIGFPDELPSVEFDFAGRRMELQIIGFRPAAEGPTLAEFISEERNTNEAVRMARVRVLAGGCAIKGYYWRKKHKDAWPVDSLDIGRYTYTREQLLVLLDAKDNKKNGLPALARELVAARLNQAAFAATSDDVEAAMAEADLAIGPLIVPPFGAGSLPAADTAALVARLEDWNEAKTGKFDKDTGRCEAKASKYVSCLNEITFENIATGERVTLKGAQIGGKYTEVTIGGQKAKFYTSCNKQLCPGDVKYGIRIVALDRVALDEKFGTCEENPSDGKGNGKRSCIQTITFENVATGVQLVRSGAEVGDPKTVVTIGDATAKFYTSCDRQICPGDIRSGVRIVAMDRAAMDAKFGTCAQNPSKK